MTDATLEESYFSGVWLWSKASAASELPSIFDQDIVRVHFPL